MITLCHVITFRAFGFVTKPHVGFVVVSLKQPLPHKQASFWSYFHVGRHLTPPSQTEMPSAKSGIASHKPTLNADNLPSEWGKETVTCTRYMYKTIQ